MPITATTLKFIKHYIIYGLGNVVNRFFTFVLVPITTRFLSVPEVGIIALLEMIELFLTTVFSQGMGPAIWRRLSDQTDQLEKKTLIYSAFVGQMLTNLLLVAMLSLFSDSISEILKFPQKFIFLLTLVFFNSLMVASTNFVFSLWRYHDKSGLFSVTSSLRFLLLVTLSIYFVVNLDLRVPGIVYAKLIVNGIGLIFSSFYILSKYWSKLSFSLYLIIQRYGAYFILLAMVTPVLNTSNRLFINQFLSLSDVGTFSIAFKFGMLINILLVTPMQMTWLPMMYKLGRDSNSKRYYRDFAFYYTVIATFLLLILTFWRRELLILFTTQDYVSGAKFIPFVAGAYVINGYRHYFMSGLAVNDRMSLIGYSSAGTILINILLNSILITNFGMWGAVIALLLSYVLLSGSIFLGSQSVVRIDWGMRRISGVIVCMLFILFLSEFQKDFNILPDFLGKLILAISYLLLLRLAGLIGWNEINGVKSLLQKVSNKIIN